MEAVDTHGNEVLVTSADGAGAIGPVAVALDAASVRVTGLTLRTPTLDDVFLEATGNRIAFDDHDSQGDTDTPTERDEAIR